MALITYQDKVTMNENPSISAINKVQASDMNEIKNVVNGNWNELAKTIGTIGTASGSFTIGNIGIEWGTVSITPENGYGSVNINLVNQYSVAPLAMACAGSGTSQITNVGTFNVSTTRISVFLTGSTTTARTCRYLVIGIISQ